VGAFLSSPRAGAITLDSRVKSSFARSSNILLCVLVLVGCGGSEATPESDTGATNTTSSGATTASGGNVVSSTTGSASSSGSTVGGTQTLSSSSSGPVSSSAGGTTGTTVGTTLGSTTSSTSVGGSATATTGGGGGSGGTGSEEACPSPALAPGDTTRTLEVGGLQRKFIVHVPDSYTGTARVPLVLDFHALGGTGSQEQSSSGYQRVADDEGFLIAFADGIDNAWNIGPCCTNSRDVDDLGFAKAMIESIATDGCVDRKRIYSVGFSMGGGMSHFLACNAADVFAAVAPAAFDLLVPEEQTCTPARPISVLAFRGTNDTTVPYAGGAGPSGRITFLGAQGSFERWAELDGCTTTTASEGSCTYYSECEGGTEVGLCVAEGGGHAPGDANVGWEFLSRFTLP